jgi:hypothetical protein
MPVGKEDLRVFRELCDAFNSLEKGDLDDPSTAKPFPYLHGDVDRHRTDGDRSICARPVD